MGIHMNAVQTSEVVQEGELSLSLLKKYIAFCRRSFYFFTFLKIYIEMKSEFN